MKALISKKVFEDGETSGAYATTMNTVGIGDPTPAGAGIGSGDLFTSTFKMAKKKSAKVILSKKNRKRKHKTTTV